jgi:hypothetical protein
MEKNDKKLIEEIENSKKWMKFLGNKNNYNRSFHQTESSENPKPLNEAKIREDIGDNINDTHGSPEVDSDALLLGGSDEEMITDDGAGVYIIISTDINGTIHTNMIESESEEDAVQQSDNEMLTQIFAIEESQMVLLITKLTQYLPEEIKAQNEPTKPPFIDEPNEDVIDEEGIVDDVEIKQ